MPDSVKALADRPARARAASAPATRGRTRSAGRGVRARPPARGKAALPDTAAAAAGDAGRRAAERRRRTGSTRSSSTAIACSRAPRAARCGCSPATATTGPRKLPHLAQALRGDGAAGRLVRRRDRHAGRAGAGRLPGAAERVRHRAHRRHRLLPVRPALLRGLRPARGAAGGAARRAAARRRAQAARQGALQRRVRRAAARTCWPRPAAWGWKA